MRAAPQTQPPSAPPPPQVHHLLSLGAHVNQRDRQGFTPLHRAAYLAHLDGYLELYEYLLVGWAGLHRCPQCSLRFA